MLDSSFCKKNKAYLLVPKHIIHCFFSRVNGKRSSGESSGLAALSNVIVDSPGKFCTFLLNPPRSFFHRVCRYGSQSWVRCLPMEKYSPRQQGSSLCCLPGYPDGWSRFLRRVGGYGWRTALGPPCAVGPVTYPLLDTAPPRNWCWKMFHSTGPDYVH